MILLVGTGYMAKEYAKVLKAMKLPFIAVGRSQNSSNTFTAEVGVKAESGGLSNWLKKNKVPSKAIVAVTEDQLGIVTIGLLNSGCKNILVEKPGGLNMGEIKKVARLAKNKRARVFVGYNRRFYASTLAALDLIKKDGGVTSFNFDFTERSYAVEKLSQSDKIKREWFIQNSSHVIDMAFYMGGWPKKISAYKKGRLSWHPSGSVYSGAGISETGALFSYQANWNSAGRWSIEIMTPKTKLIFRPLEKLQIQKYGSMTIEDYPLKDTLDINFKPGLFKQVESFLNNHKELLTTQEQIKHLETYSKIKIQK